MNQQNPNIPQEIIDNIRDRIDIAEIIGQHVELKRMGNNLKGLCPFHQEKTPSFNVNPDRQIFHCFGCGKGGNVFTFLMEVEGVSFPEAVRALGRRAGVEVPTRRVSDADRSRNAARFRANEFAARYYERQLADPRVGKTAREYLAGRGIPQSEWPKFRLGYAPDRWDGLWSAARREGLPREALTELRLIVERERSTGYYDYFRNRLMFPIISVSGSVLGFGARALDEKTEPKYLNSAESPVFAKRRTFYGMDTARDAIRERKEALVVEGYTDLIALHMAGLGHTVAACGTALTPDHGNVLRRLTQRAVLLPDGDDAGQTAAVSAGAILAAAGIEVRVVRFEAGVDPDGAVRDLGAAGISQLIDQSMDYFGYLNYIVNNRSMSARDQEALIQRVVAGIAHVDDALRYDLLTKEIAKSLGVAPESLRAKRRAAPRRSEGGAAPRAVPPERGASRMAVEKLALRLILEGTPQSVDAIDSLDEEDFCSERCRKLYKLLDLARESHIDIRSQDFLRQAEAAGLERFTAEIALIPLPPGNVETLLKDTVRRIKEIKIRDELNAIQEKIKELPLGSEEDTAYLAYYDKLTKALKEL